MKIEYLYIDGYKNLFKFEAYFESGTSLMALAGKNGSGKSNVLEAVAKIFAFIMTEGETPGFTFSIQYVLHGDTVVIENKKNSLKVSKNAKTVPKSQLHSIVPLTLFLYYAGETERLKGLSDKANDKAFDKRIKSGEMPSYKSMSYLSVNDFGRSLLVTRCYGLSKSKVLEDILGIENIAKQCKLYFKRPSWGKRGLADYSIYTEVCSQPRIAYLTEPSTPHPRSLSTGALPVSLKVYCEGVAQEPSRHEWY